MAQRERPHDAWPSGLPGMSNYEPIIWPVAAKVLAAAAKDRSLPGRARAVLDAIAGHADKKGCCRPSQGRIGKLTGIHRTNVCKMIGFLEERGYLAKAGRHHRACVYWLTDPSSCVRDDTQSCVRDDTLTNPENILPPVVPPKGDVAASAGADRSPKRRPRAARGRRGGQEAATPPPSPRPSDRGGGASLPGDMELYHKQTARHVGKCAKSKAARPRSPPDTPLQRALDSGILTEEMRARLIAREMAIGEAAALEEFGFTARGSPKGKPP